MNRFIFCILLIGRLLVNNLYAEEITWDAKESYAPMPVLFIHGINANALTWKDSIPKLKSFFNYRDVKSDGNSIVSDDIRKQGGDAVTWFKDGKYESPAKLYLEAFDYGGKDKAGSALPIKDNYAKLKEEIQKVLKAYYGEDKWQENKLILVAHSQGGLIGRYYLQQGGADKVKRLITINTPHTGSMLAPLAWTILAVPFNPLNSPYNYMFTGGVYGGFVSYYNWNLFKAQLKSMITLKGSLCDLVPWSKFVKEVNTTDMPEGIEYICIVGKAPQRVYNEKEGKWVTVPDKYIDSDTVVSGKSQRSEYKGQQTICWDEIITIADGDKGSHGNSPKQHDKILQALDGIPDKGTRIYDTPRVTLGTYTLYSKTSAENFYITGKIYDYLLGSCTVTVEIDNPGNYARDKVWRDIRIGG